MIYVISARTPLGFHSEAFDDIASARDRASQLAAQGASRIVIMKSGEVVERVKCEAPAAPAEQLVRNRA